MGFVLGSRSLERLKGVDPRLVNVVKLAISLSEIDFSVLEGVRTLARQRELYAQGRTKPGKIGHLDDEEQAHRGQGGRSDPLSAWHGRGARGCHQSRPARLPPQLSRSRMERRLARAGAPIHLQRSARASQIAKDACATGDFERRAKNLMCLDALATVLTGD